MSEADNAPKWNGRRGRYEVWFLTLTRTDGRIGYWIRYSLRSPVVGPPERRAWFARFDRDRPERTFGISVPVDADAQGGDYFRAHDAVLGPGGAGGVVSGGSHRARWSLRWEPGQPTVRILPAPFYRGGMVPTLPYTPNPDLRFTGIIDVDGEEDELVEAPGQQGHLYGTKHAERWAWAACNAFNREGWAFQALSGQGRRGPFLTPFLTFAALRMDGRWVRFRGVTRRRTWGLGSWQMSMVAKGYRLEGAVNAPPDVLIRTRYLDPDDTPRWAHNCEVASSSLRLWERRPGGWQQVAELASDGTTHAEWVGRTPASSVANVHEEVA